MTNSRGFSLLELSIALVMLAVLSLPISRLLKAQQAADQTSRTLQLRSSIMESVSGFVLAHRRLPCPTLTPNDAEAWNDGQCAQAAGWLPTRSLGLSPEFARWRMSVATLQNAGPPAANALTAQSPLQGINLPTLTDIVNTPPNGTRTLSNGALPAIHICIGTSAQALPNPDQPGCQGLTTQTTTAVLVVYPEQVNPSVYQFVIQPNAPLQNPIWLSYERLVWLWMQAGTLNPL